MILPLKTKSKLGGTFVCCFGLWAICGFLEMIFPEYNEQDVDTGGLPVDWKMYWDLASTY